MIHGPCEATEKPPRKGRFPTRPKNHPSTSAPRSFRKPEHLCLRRDIEAVFSAGSRSLSAYPVRAVFRRASRAEGPQAKVLVSVSKRRLRRAVDRNRAKRLLREAYRLNKSLLAPALREGEALHLALIWLPSGLASFEQVEKSVSGLLLRLSERLKAENAERSAP